MSVERNDSDELRRVVAVLTRAFYGEEQPPHVNLDLLRARVHAFLGSQSPQQLDDLLRMVASCDGSLSALWHLVSMGESTWFGDLPQYFRWFHLIRTFRDQGILSESRPLQILCMGCGTGPEAYSAALVCQRLQAEGIIGTYQVTAIDADALAIRQAQTNLFPLSDLGRIPTIFHPSIVAMGASFALDSGVAGSITFRCRDFRALALIPERYDVVLCRNVLGYCGVDRQRSSLQVLRSVLAQFGVLCVAQWERMLLGSSDLQHLGNGIFSCRTSRLQTTPAQLSRKPVKKTVAVVHINRPTGHYLARGLRRLGLRVSYFQTPAHLRVFLEHQKVDLIVSGFLFRQHSAMKLLKDIRQQGITVPVILNLNRLHPTIIQSTQAMGIVEYFTTPLQSKSFLNQCLFYAHHPMDWKTGGHNLDHDLDLVLLSAIDLSDQDMLQILKRIPPGSASVVVHGVTAAPQQQRLRELITSQIGFDCRVVTSHMALAADSVCFGPADQHLMIYQRHGALTIDAVDGPKLNNCRPSLGVLMDSVKKAVGGSCFIVVAGFLGRDGLHELEALRRQQLSQVIVVEPTNPRGGIASALTHKWLDLADVHGPIDAASEELRLRLDQQPLRQLRQQGASSVAL